MFYIPYGSDKTGHYDHVHVGWKEFTSYIVQIKRYEWSVCVLYFSQF